MEPHILIEDYAHQHHFELKKLTIDNFIAYQISAENLVDLLKFVKNEPNLRFNILSDLFAADFPDRIKRFEVTYHLLSLKLNKRLLFKIELGTNEQIISVATLLPAACWYEREIFDMFGIIFDKSPDLRRILTDYGFVGHPLRKDFPLSGHLQVKYDKKMEKVIYEPVFLEQEFRDFDFTSPWQGPKTLPGDEKAN